MATDGKTQKPKKKPKKALGESIKGWLLQPVDSKGNVGTVGSDGATNPPPFPVLNVTGGSQDKPGVNIPDVDPKTSNAPTNEMVFDFGEMPKNLGSSIGAAAKAIDQIMPPNLDMGSPGPRQPPADIWSDFHLTGQKKPGAEKDIYDLDLHNYGQQPPPPAPQAPPPATGSGGGPSANIADFPGFSAVPASSGPGGTPGGQGVWPGPDLSVYGDAGGPPGGIEPGFGGLGTDPEGVPEPAPIDKVEPPPISKAVPPERRTDFLALLQGQLADYVAGGIPMNLQPAAALVDTWTGSNLAPYIKPPYTANQYQQNVTMLQDQIRKYVQNQQQLKNQMDRATMQDALGRAQLDERKRKNTADIADAKEKLKINWLNARANMTRAKNYGQQVGKMGTGTDWKQIKDEAQFRRQFFGDKNWSKVTATLDYLTNLRKFEELIYQYGNAKTGVGRRRLEAQARTLGLDFKENKNLGAITGPDEKFIDGVIANPAGFLQGLSDKWLRGGQTGYVASIADERARVKSGFNNHWKNTILKKIPKTMGPEDRADITSTYEDFQKRSVSWLKTHKAKLEEKKKNERKRQEKAGKARGWKEDKNGNWYDPNQVGK